MPLTPTDVANKQFRIAFRGYSLDEVDAFLDEVETELTRLLRERSAPSPVVPLEEPGQAVVEPAAAAPVAPLTGMEGQESALRTLLLAQRTADAAIAEAQAQADELLATAKAEAERTLTQARTEASSTLQGARGEAEKALSSARAEAERTVTAARGEAHQTVTAAREKGTQLEQEVAAKVAAATGGLEVRRRQLEGRIEELRAFEREYRTRLKAYLEAQLRELGAGHQASSDETGVGVPADARAAAVGGASAVRRPVDGPAGDQPARPEPATGPVQGAVGDGQGETQAGRAERPGEGVPSAPPVRSAGQPVGPFSVVRAVPDTSPGGGVDADPPAER